MKPIPYSIRLFSYISAVILTTAGIGYYLVFAANTTIGNNISTSGTLTVGSYSLFSGAINASSTLQVSATTTLYGILVSSSTATSTFANGIQLSGGCFRDITGTCITSSGGGGGSGTVNSGTQGQIAFYDSTGTAISGTSTIFVSTTTLNVGIGTTTPGTKFSVHGNVQISGDANIANLNATGTLTANNLSVTSSTTLQNFTANNSTTTQATTTYLAVSGTASATQIIVSQNSFFGGLSNFISGMISSASSTFSNILNVTGLANFSSLATFSNGFVSTASSTISNSLNVSGGLSASSTLSVGGGTALGSTLSVTGTSTLSGLSAGFGTFSGNLIASGRLDVSGLSSLSGFISNSSSTVSGTFNAGDTTVNNATINGTQSVSGLATFSAGFLAASSSVTGITTSNSTTTNATTTTLYVSGPAAVGGTVAISGTLSAGSTTISNLSVTNTSTSTIAGGLAVQTDKLIVDKNTGNVGVGSTTPGAKLSVSGTSLFDGLATFYNALVGNITATGTTNLSAINLSGLASFANGFLSTSSSTVSSLFNVSGQLNASSTLLVGGNSRLYGTLTVDGATILSSSLSVTGQTTLSNASTTGMLTVGNGAIITGSSTISGPLQVSAPISASSTLSVENLSTLAGGFISSASSSVAGTLHVSGAIQSSTTISTPTLSATEATSTYLAVTGSASTSQLIVSNNSFFGNIANFINGIISSASSTFSNILNVTGLANFSSLATFSNGFLSTASSTVNANLNVSGPLSASSTLSVSGMSFLNGGLLISGSTTVSSLFNVSGPLNASSTLLVANLSSLYGGFISSASSTVAGDFTVTGNLLASSTITVTGTSGTSTIGSITIGPNGNVLIGTTTSSSLVSNLVGGAAGFEIATRTIALNSGADGTLGAWATTTGLPGTLNNMGVITANGYIYTLGGSLNGTNVATNFYSKLNSDGTVGPWATVTNALPSINYSRGGAFANGYVYSMGNINVAYSKLNGDGTNGVFGTTGNFPSGYTNFTVEKIAVSNGYLYAFGGRPANTISTSTVLYAKFNSDGSLGNWNSIFGALATSSNSGVAAAANGYVYYLGGDTGGTGTVAATSTVYYAKVNADGSLGAFVTNVNYLPAPLEGLEAFISNGYIYVLGGQNSSSVRSSAVYYAKLNADGSIGVWQTNPNSLPGPRSNASANFTAVANGYTYVVGESDGTNQRTVFYSSLPRTLISGNLDLIGLASTTVSDWGGDVGSVGGSIFAGSIFSAGRLEVAGNTQLWGGLGVNGIFSLTASTSVLQTSSIFSIQNATGTVPLFSLAYNGGLGVGTTSPASGSVFMNGNFGIGTSTPGALFAVQGNSFFSGNLNVANITATGTVSAPYSFFSPNAYLRGLSGFNSSVNTDGNFSLRDSAFANVSSYFNPTVNFANIGSIQAGQANFTSGGTFATHVDYSTADYPYAVAIGDLNGDGRNDMVTGQYTGANISVFIHATSSVTAFNGRLDYTGQGTYSDVTIKDIDGDGKNDVIASRYGGSVFSVFYNNATSTQFGGSSLSRTDYTNGLGGGFHIAVGDLNGDGKPDIAMSNTAVVSVFLNKGNRKFAAPVTYAVSAGTQSGVAIADFNGDGNNDLVVAGNTTNVISVLLNNGDGTFATEVEYATAANSPEDVTVGDLNGDGAPDIALSYDSAKTSVFLNNGDGTFAPHTDYTTGLAYSLKIGDLNGDGKNDIATLRGSTVSVLLNNGDGTFASEATYATAASGIGIAIGDLNIDGKLDIVSTNGSGSGDGKISVLFNNPVSMLFANALNGNVGIGTTSPYSKFSVWSSGTTTGQLFSLVNSASSTLFQVLDNGNVGIGTTTPSAQLHIFASSTLNTTALRIDTNGATGPWATTTGLPVPEIGHSVVAANGYIYSLGGTQGSVPGGSTRSTIYFSKVNSDGSLGAWASTTGVLTSALAQRSAEAYNGYIYYNAAATETSAKINSDGSLSNFIALNNYPPGYTSFTKNAGVVSNGYLYHIGGRPSNVLATSSIIYAKLNADGTTGSWTQQTNAMATSSSSGAAVAANGYVYYIGGDTSGSLKNDATSTVYYAKVNADGSLGTFVTSPNYLPSALEGLTANVANGYIYTMGGQDSNGATTTAVYFTKLNSDGSIGAWQTNPNPLPSARSNIFSSNNSGGNFSTVINGYIYVVGGGGPGGPDGVWRSTVFYSSLPRVLISGNLDLLGLASTTLGDWGGDSGSIGGSIFAGSIFSAGQLTVTGSSQLYGGLGVSGMFSLTASSSAPQNKPIFSIQAATSSGPFMSVLYNGTVGIGSNEGGLLIGTTTPGAGLVMNGQLTIIASTSAAHPAALSVQADGSIGPWASTSSMIVQRSAFGSVVVNGFIYAFNGVDVNGAYTNTANYARINSDGSLSPWATTTTGMAFSETLFNVVTYNGYIYTPDVGTGGSSPNSVGYAKVNSDGTLGAWKIGTNPQFPGGPTTNYRSYQQFVVARGYLYVLGGADNANVSTSSVLYTKLNADGSFGSWASTTALINIDPTNSLGYGTTYLSANGYIYRVGNYSVNGSVTYTKVNTDGTLGNWQTTNSLPVATGSVNTAVVANGYLEVFSLSGNNLYFAKLNSDGTLGAWQAEKTASPASNYSSENMVTANGYLYRLGGSDNSGNRTDSVLYASFARTQILGDLDLIGLSSTTFSDFGSGDNNMGGSLHAGNLFSQNRLEVGGLSSLWGGLSVNGLFSLSASTSVLQTASIFSIQNATGTQPILNILYNGNIFTGGNLIVGTTSSPTFNTNSQLTVFASTTATTPVAFSVQTDGGIGSWASTSSTIVHAQRRAAAIANGYVYVLGGLAPAGALTSVESAKINSDGSLGVWATSTPLANSIQNPAAVTANGYLYSIDYDAGNLIYSKINKDGSLGAWNNRVIDTFSVKDLKRSAAALAVANNYLYILGGVDAGSGTTSVIYTKLNNDGSIGSWASTTAMTSARYGFSSVASNGYIYAISGSIGNPVTGQVDYAQINPDGTLGNWAVTSALPVNGTWGNEAVVINGYLYNNNGNTMRFAKINSNGSLGGWQANLNQPQQRSDSSAMVTANGYIYSVDGETSVYLSDVVYASIARTQIFGVLDMLGYASSSLSGFAGDNGTLGSSIYAGNIFSQNNLDVEGVASLWGGLNVNGMFSLSASSSAPQYASIFSIQNATSSSPFLSVLYNGAVGVGNLSTTTNAQFTVMASTTPAHPVAFSVQTDGSIGPWASTTRMTNQRRRFGAAAANGYVYAFGGLDATGANSLTLEYSRLNSDGSLGAWATGTPLLTAESGIYGGVSNGYLYTLDVNTTRLNYSKINRDGSNGAWKAATVRFPGTGSMSNAGFVFSNGYVYVAGGVDDSSSATTSVVFAKVNSDGSIGAFASTTAMPRARSKNTVVAANGYLYAVGAYVTLTNAVDYAKINPDGTLGNWLTTTSLPASTGWLQNTVVINGYIYTVNADNTTLYFAKINNDGTLSAWQTSPFRPSVSYNGVTIVSANGYIYSLGGENLVTGAPIDYVQYTSTARSIFSGSLDLLGYASSSLSGFAGGDGSLGSSIYAGNIFSQNNLDVEGVTSLWGGLNVGGMFSLTASSSVVQSNSIFSIQNATTSYALFSVLYNGVVGVGNIGTTSNSQFTVMASIATNTPVAFSVQTDGSLGQWATSSGLGTALKDFGAVSANGYLYTLGGTMTGGAASAAVQYAKVNSDGTTGAWATSSNSLPVALEFNSAVVGNGFLYSIGGDTAVKPVYYARINDDGSTGAWKTSLLPIRRQDHTSVFANGYVYVMGGSDGVTATTSVIFAKQNSDGSLGDWASTTALATAKTDAESAVANGYMYIFGGADPSTSSTVYYAKINPDGTLGNWAAAKSMPTARTVSSVVISNGYVYSIGGASTNQNFIYFAKLNSDGSLGNWSTNSTLLPTVRRNHASVIVNGYVYVIGGQDGSFVFPTVFYASVARTQISGDLDLIGLSSTTLSDFGGDNGSIGSSLYAGNIFSQNRLEVGGTASLWGGLNVNGLFSLVAASSSGPQYSSIFSIQNATSSDPLFSVLYNGAVGVGNLSTTTNAQFTVMASTTAAHPVAFSVQTDGSIGPWASTTGMINRKRYFGAAAVNGYIYAVGGYGDAGAMSSVEQAKINGNGSLGPWATSSNSLPATSYTNSVVSANGYIYSVLGVNSGADSRNIYYTKVNSDGSLSPWTTDSNPIPSNARENVQTAIANGYIYILGGYDGTAATTSVIYAKLGSDGSTGPWASTTAMSIARYQFTALAANGYMYAFGLNSGSTAVDYAKINPNGTLGNWATTSALPAIVGNGQGAVVLNGYIYVVEDGVTGKIYFAKLNSDGTLGAWNTSMNYPQQITYEGGVVAVNGYIYNIGGSSFNPATSVNDVVYTSVARTQIQGDLDLIGLSSTTLSGFSGDTGAVGSSLYAGNIFAQNRLEVAGNASLWGGLSVNGLFSLTASTSASQTASIFTIQNATSSSPLFSVLYNGNIGIGTSTPSQLVSIYGGNFSLQTTINSANAFQILNAASSTILNVDTTGTATSTFGPLTIGKSKWAFGTTTPTAGFEIATSSIALGSNQDGSLTPWATTTSMLDQRRFMSAVTANGYIYALGGLDPASASLASVEYVKINSNGTLGQWATSSNPLPVAKDTFSAVTANGYLYAVGGTNVSTVYYTRINSDGSTGSWLKANPLVSSSGIVTVRQDEAAATANGYIYVIGGTDNSSATTSVIYAKLNNDGSLGAWASTSAIASGGNGGTSAVAANGYMYMMQYESSQGAIKAYSAKINSDGSLAPWLNGTTVVSGNPGAGTYTPVVINGYLYFGATTAGSSGGAAFEYAKLNSDGTFGTFILQNQRTMPISSTGGTVTANGYIYSLGGFSNNVSNTSVNDVVYASVARTKIFGDLDLIGFSSSTLSDFNGGGGSMGGSIFAGNIFSAGNLQVIGNSQLWGGVSVSGMFSLTASSSGQQNLPIFTIQTATSSNPSLSVLYDGGVVIGAVSTSTLTTGQLTIIASTTSAHTSALSIQTDGSVGNWASTTGANVHVSDFGAVTASGYVYVLSGNTNAQALGFTEYARMNSNGSIGSWATTTALPTASSITSAATANGYVYTFGSDATPVPIYYSKINADGSLSSWKTNPNSYPLAQTSMTMVTGNGYIYMLGGQEGGGATTSVVYATLNADGSTGPWASTTALADKRYYLGSAYVNGYIYAISGAGSATDNKTVYYAKVKSDGSLGNWVSTSAMSEAKYGMNNTVVMNGYLYVYDGYNAGAVRDALFYAKINGDGSLGVWQTNPSRIPLGSGRGGFVGANGYLYAIAGLNAGNNNPLNDVFYASVARTKIQSDLDLTSSASSTLSDWSGENGNTGSSIYAGNVFSQNRLDVGGNASLWGGLSVNGLFSMTASSSLVQNVSIFSVQNATATNPLFTILYNGNVGIGTSSPRSALAVVGNIAVTGCVQAATSTFNLTPATTCADLAESYIASEDLEPGDIVSLAQGSVFRLEKSTASSKVILGAISSHPAVLFEGSIASFGSPETKGSYSSGEKAPLALSGRIPVKVNLEGGEISIGDPITISSVPGIGKKATESGRIIGYALEDFTASTTENGGKVLVFSSLENWTASSSIANNGQQANDNSSLLSQAVNVLKDWLASMQVFISDGLVRMKFLKAEKVITDGIEMKDKSTGEVYCVNIENGEFIKTLGECGASAQQSSGNSTTTPTTAADTTAPIITLTGDNTITITRGDTWVDPGASVSDPADDTHPINNNLSIYYKVNGTDTGNGGRDLPQTAIDTNQLGTSTISYISTDSAGNTGTAERSLIVVEPSPAP